MTSYSKALLLFSHAQVSTPISLLECSVEGGLARPQSKIVVHFQHLGHRQRVGRVADGRTGCQ
jgi:hypothetical protein